MSLHFSPFVTGEDALPISRILHPEVRLRDDIFVILFSEIDFNAIARLHLYGVFFHLHQLEALLCR